jgi:uncharacterized protein (TIGR00730 family)
LIGAPPKAQVSMPTAQSPSLKTIVVYCGSSDSIRPEYLEMARGMGRALAGHGIEIVFGGGRTGMMGALADAALQAGGRVVGVIPKQFNNATLAHDTLSEMIVVDSMHDRKARMAEMGQAFLALPGGFGTLEELFEILTWAQIGLHHKPVGLLNSHGYFDPLLALIEHARREGFIYNEHPGLLVCEADPERLLAALEAYRAPDGLERWVGRR